MAASLHAHLLAILEDASNGLNGVARKRMFGCDTLFAEGAIYALVWKTGRIGLRLPDPAMYDALMGQQGAGPWTAGSKAMSHWVLVPEDFHDDEEQLALWVRRAHALASGGAGKQPKAEKKPAAKGPAARRRSPPS